MCMLFHVGPFGERDDQQVFIQKVIPITNKLFVRLSSTGKRYVFFKTQITLIIHIHFCYLEKKVKAGRELKCAG